MSPPIVRLGTAVLASLQNELIDSEWRELQRELLAATRKRLTQSAVIDVTGMEIVDSYAARTLANTATLLKLRGVRAIVAGIQPDVAIAMSRLGLGLVDVDTCLDLEEAMLRLGARLPGASVDD